MSTRPYYIILTAITLIGLCVERACAEQDHPPVLAHYMPWYASEPVSGAWGWHWTMNTFNPGDPANPTFATHDPPLIGPYDSTDPHLIEYHVLLLKIAGIDGFVFDWYGVSDFRDYAFIHRSTLAMIDALEGAGLKFAICYEDQSVKHRAEELGLTAEQVLDAGRADIGWLRDVAFQDPHYLRINGRPVLMIFGPQYFTSEQWQELRPHSQPQNPLLFGLPHLIDETGMDGPMGWPPVYGGREIPVTEWTDYLARLSETGVARGQYIHVAFPGFHDIYEEAGVHPSYGSIDPRNGDTLRETLQRALNSSAPIIQIATWNDFGEGTVIEPTTGLGYRNLEIVQELLGTATQPVDLRLPAELYRLRKRAVGLDEAQAMLDQAAQAVIEGRFADARQIIETLKSESLFTVW